MIRRQADILETAQGETMQGRQSRFFREENEYPAIVERHVSIKLEMMIRLCYNVLAGRGMTRSAEVSVDDHFATSEWGASEVTQLRCLIWTTHAPRIDTATKGEK